MKTIGDNEGFTAAVYAVVAQIPAGKVLTYGRIAALAGFPGRARMVGRMMSGASTEHGLPCHRVVNSVGRLAPCWPQQAALLQQEGVAVRENGCVDMKKHLWKPGNGEE